MPFWTDYYNCLGVDENSTPAQINQAYDVLILTCDPNIFPNKAAEFLKIQEAYEILIKRTEYISYIVPQSKGSDAF